MPRAVGRLAEAETDFSEFMGVWNAEGQDKKAKLNVMKKSVGYSGQVAIGKRLAETQNWMGTAWYSLREEFGRDQCAYGASEGRSEK